LQQPSPYLGGQNIKIDIVELTKIVSLIKDRANFVSDFWEISDFFEGPTAYDAKSKQKTGRKRQLL
jgi:glutamyl-tRNA synthetase